MAKLSRQTAPDAPPAPPEPAPAPPAEPPAPPETALERIAKADEAIRKRLFIPRKGKAKETSAEPAPGSTTAPVATEPTPPAPPVEPAPELPKAPAKRVSVRDPNMELVKLEQQRLEFERQKLEWERQKVQQAQPQSTPQAPPALGLLTDEERYEYEVFGQMDTMEPGRDYQGRFLKSVEAAAAHKAKWEKDNEGETFDPNDSAHDAFYAKHSLKYDKGAFRRAEIQLAQPQQPKVDAATQNELRRLKAKAALADIQPRQLRATALAIKGMLEDVDKDMAQVAATEGSAELLKKYPAKGRKMMAAAASVNQVATEAFRILETDGLVEPDDSPAHALILNIIARQEPLISSQTIADQTLPDGRVFAKWEKWVTLSPEQRASYWHLGAEEVVDIFSQAEAAKLKAEMEIIEQEFSARNPRPAPAPAPLAPRAAPPPPSPAGGSRPVIDTTANRPPDGTPALDKKLRSILFQRAS